MSLTIEYYFAPNSPWTYLGHQRLRRMALDAGARIEVLPIDLARVFPQSGGLPLTKRAPQRQAYRLVELKRFSQWLALPLNLHPKHFPVSADGASKLIIGVQMHDGDEAALDLCAALMRAVWAEDRDIADAATLGALLEESGLPQTRLGQSLESAVQARYDAHTERAMAAQIFGAPTYVVNGEPFWGQDRLEFLERRLSAG